MDDEDKRAEVTRVHFNARAAEYDAQRPYRLHYAEMQQVLLRAIPYTPETAFTVLELGIGTALLTEQLLKHFPYATVAGYDLSEEMLARARARLAPFGTRAILYQADFVTTLPDNKTYNLICSSIALHHLPRAHRDHFYQRLATCLIPGGALVVGDTIKPPTEALAVRYTEMEQREIQELGWSAEILEAKRRQQEENRLRLAGIDHGASTLDDFLEYLRGAGLINVDCLWKHGTMVVVYAERARG
jgi:trans-aconitate methyltransferase